ncbi:TraX family protein [Streptococcus orisratti]|uniref:TraX family protein n=1 Tax=Streptococcus orisratti TaxID=114652 RepID=UPI003D01F137
MLSKKGLNNFDLKYFALFFMVLDHIHYFFEFTGKIPLWFSQIGRLAAPLFLFCVIEGFVHTHNRKRYFLQMYSLSVGMGLVQFGFYNVLSEFVRKDGFFPQNMMLSSFAILLVVLQGIAWFEEKKYLRGIVTTILPIILPWLFMPLYQMASQSGNQWLSFPLSFINFTILPLHTTISDGGTATLIVGIVMYLCRKSLKREVLGFVLASLLVDLGRVFLLVPTMGLALTPDLLLFKAFEWMEIFAAPFMLAYNGERGRGPKWLFYIFYPAHIYLLYALSFFLYKG